MTEHLCPICLEIIENENETCSPTARSNGPVLISNTQSNPSGSVVKKEVCLIPSRESK